MRRKRLVASLLLMLSALLYTPALSVMAEDAQTTRKYKETIITPMGGYTGDTAMMGMDAEENIYVIAQKSTFE